MENWLNRQMCIQVQGWEKSMQKFYPDYSKSWTDPEEHFKMLKEQWNFLDAVRWLDWKELLKGESIRVLDLGCGSGWLASFLSLFPEVKEIDALDSSDYNLSVMLPEIIRMTGGNRSKINSVLGLFYPLLASDEHYDVIVASCSIHHSPELSEVLRECRRSLKRNGRLIILNETPLPSLRYFLKIAKFGLSVTTCLMKRSFPEHSPSLSRSGYLYDPYLGDKIYTHAQWEQAIRQAGFIQKTLRTPFYPDKKKANQVVKLHHFLCEKI